MHDRTVTLTGHNGSLTIAARPDVDRGKEYLENVHHRFLLTHWPGLAAAAYDGFRRHGAGAVVLMMGEHTAEDEPYQVREIWYTTQLQGLAAPLPTWPSSWEAQQVDRYDPQNEGVFIFVDADRLAVVYRVEGHLTPVQAHTRMQALLN